MISRGDMVSLAGTTHNKTTITARTSVSLSHFFRRDSPYVSIGGCGTWSLSVGVLRSAAGTTGELI